MERKYESFEMKFLYKPYEYGEYGRKMARRNQYPTSLDVVERFDGQRFEDTELLWMDDDYVMQAFIKALDYSTTLMRTDWRKAHGFYLHSKHPGRCKTSIANCVREFMLDNSIRCEVVNEKQLVRLSKSSNSSNYDHYDSVRGFTPFLVIDDVGITDINTIGYKGAEYNEVLYEVLNTRLSKGLVTAFTSNYTYEQLLERGYSIQNVDRIRELTRNYSIEVPGTSVRCSDMQEVDEERYAKRSAIVKERLKNCHADDAIKWDEEQRKEKELRERPQTPQEREFARKLTETFTKGLTHR